MEIRPDSSASTALPMMRLRYAGTCVLCGTAVATGEMARYDRATKTVRCVACPGADATAVEQSIDVGVAGASARREGERRTTQREARTKERYGDRFGSIVLAITPEPQTTRAWARGAAGERKLAAALARVPGVIALHDRRVPGTKGNLDHLVIAPAGVFVADAKHYTGSIRIRDKGGLFHSDSRLYVGSRDCSQLADDMGWQVDVVTAVLRSAGSAETLVTPVLCFVEGEWPLLFPPSSFNGVRLEGPRSLAKLITRTTTLEADEIARLAAILATALPPK